MAKSTSIKRQFLIFSVILFMLILVGGSAVFVLSMRQIVQNNTGHDLEQTAEIERIKLEASVNSEIAIALKMADSPLIKRHFLDPGDSALRRIAFEEIEGYRKAFKSNQVFWASDSDKEFYFAEDNHYTIDAEDPGNYWYKMTLHETEKYNFNINYNPEIQKTNLWINAPVFDSWKTPIGLVGTGIDLTEFVDSIYRNYKGGGSLFLFNEFGEITGASDASLIAKKSTLESVLGDTGKEILSKAKALKPNETTSFDMAENTIAVGTIPGLHWFITVEKHTTLSDVLRNSMTIIFVSMMTVILVIFIVFYLFITRLLKPLKLMIKVLEQISGNWDLTRRLEALHKDETGTLAEFFNLTFDRMNDLIKEIKMKAFSLVNTGQELSATMGETYRSVGKVNSNIEKMRGLVLSQADAVNTTAKSTDQIISGLDNLNNQIAIQADVVAQSSSAIEEMLANISSVTNTLVKNTENINSLAGSSAAGKIDLEKVSKDIQEIAKDSEGLLEINSVMENISSQTNLLSMNAAIEAAHAGESGKGFAVVAAEIRKLAENSGKQSQTISLVLKKIKTSIDTITKSTAIVLERFSTIESEVSTVSNQETMIRKAMEEQETGSRHILQAVTRLNSVTGEVKTSSSDMLEISHSVLNQSAHLKEMSSNVAEGMDDMTQQADVINGAVKRVQEIGQANQDYINALNTGIGRFKVE